MQKYTVYTDGSCRGTYGGWGFVILGSERELHGYGGAINSTNNQMELMAAIEALSCFTGSDNNIKIITDSQYLQDGMNKYLKRWINSGFRTANGKPVKNIPLWKELNNLQARFSPAWFWVKGHSGAEHNEMADSLAARGVEIAEDYNGQKTERSLHNFKGIQRADNTLTAFYMHGQPQLYEATPC